MMKDSRRARSIIGMTILIIALLAACGGAAVEPPVESTPPGDGTPGAVTPVIVDMDDVTEVPPADDSPGEMPAPGIPDPETFMTERVRAALADRLNIDISAVSVVDAEEVEWSDAALGCPMPEQMYVQVITPGFRITVSAEGETYTYHTDMDGNMVLCGPDGQPVGELR
jgi:hypothetical protein